jgi:hypothetical protein
MRLEPLSGSPVASSGPSARKVARAYERASAANRCWLVSRKYISLSKREPRKQSAAQTQVISMRWRRGSGRSSCTLPGCSLLRGGAGSSELLESVSRAQRDCFRLLDGEDFLLLPTPLGSLPWISSKRGGGPGEADHCGSGAQQLPAARALFCFGGQHVCVRMRMYKGV